MIKIGDLISFKGNYIILDNDKAKIEMNIKAREGIVLEIHSGSAKTFSENEICILSLTDFDTCLIEKLT